MTWNDLVYGLGDLLEATFEILPPLGNIPNIIFILIIFASLVYWMIELGKYKKKAKQEGSIE
ncbi:DUF6341 family protein [Acidiluteibacter ferrifornacis]|uniref:Uncharacterized protein n=1 Tax=Acidiluteibacter ferrifornacis TaxID=2692424 RepID=A0A6N9NGD4_9FLAO|nr:hypothetical protein [Acidiluteibacter ferrifornacis]MBR9830849.1 hypothetical protein [bacterium]NBG64872.1 hypothetical protein [Acidiluteibacter ferrifornacis]